jgi:hypothetical protein
VCALGAGEECSVVVISFVVLHFVAVVVFALAFHRLLLRVLYKFSQFSKSQILLGEVSRSI